MQVIALPLIRIFCCLWRLCNNFPLTISSFVSTNQILRCLVGGQLSWHFCYINSSPPLKISIGQSNRSNQKAVIENQSNV